MKTHEQWIYGLGAAWWIVKAIVIWRHCRTQRNEG